MRMALAALCGAIAVSSSSSTSVAQVQCAAYKQMVGLLTKKFSEAPLAMGTVNEDRLMQLFVSEGGSWTIIVTKADGMACILAAGQNWEKLPQVATGPSA